MIAASRFSLETCGYSLVLWINYLAAVGIVPVALNSSCKEIETEIRGERRLGKNLIDAECVKFLLPRKRPT